MTVSDAKRTAEKAIAHNQHSQALQDKIDNKTVVVGVIGLGYVGLPFLVEKAKVGLTVIGFDHSPLRVEQVAKGESYINDVDSGELAAIVAKGNVQTTTDTKRINDCDVLIICVPTPLDKNLCPDLSYVTSVSESIAENIKPGQLISLESTTYPGTTVEVIQPILEKSGLKRGEDFFLAHSPERVDPGNARYTTKNTNKVVGADDERSLAVAKSFYELAIQYVVPVSSSKAAEMVKVFENTYRSVNIALANEMALLCDKMNINVWEMLDAAFTKPFGIMPFYPGPGVGGHCIPIDPHYLEWKAKEYHFSTRFISLAGEINRRMPQFVYNKVARLLNKYKKSINGANILLLGMAYKPNLPDYRESPAIDVYKILKSGGAGLSYYDPYVPEIEIDADKVQSIELNKESLKSYDLVIITTQHQCVNYQEVFDHAAMVFDTRNVTRGIEQDNIERL